MNNEEKEYKGFPLESKVLSAMEDTIAKDLSEQSELSGEDDERSIDERAEKFIERFYEKMRIQRQELLM